jgi:hypothetical protein
VLLAALCDHPSSVMSFAASGCFVPTPADPSATANTLAQALATAQSSGNTNAVAQAFAQAVSRGGGAGAQAVAQAYAQAVGAGRTAAAAQAIAAASASVSVGSQQVAWSRTPTSSATDEVLFAYTVVPLYVQHLYCLLPALLAAHTPVHKMLITLLLLLFVSRAVLLPLLLLRCWPLPLPRAVVRPQPSARR